MALVPGGTWYDRYTLDLAKYKASKSKKPGVTYTTVPGTRYDTR